MRDKYELLQLIHTFVAQSPIRTRPPGTSGAMAALGKFCLVVLILALQYASANENEQKESTPDSGAGKLPPGHLKPLGYHRPAEGPIDAVEEFPEPQEFYEKYVKPGIPVLFKGLAKRMQNFNEMTDAILR